ncbi:IclR family transcriptional regulator [Mediterraneibacter massiliensis]|uniref:IclR family transcriptional regulator n=1 Tax=Mediterraneibacter massiliensis TaxID=1720300 RepID=UPI000E49A9DB|nr:IclR family transcriptional regulator [Mediterraneibacter massiliensis]RGT73825.1 IclR family transcriptional regulator [Ruminococcus sp. AF18-22]
MKTNQDNEKKSKITIQSVDRALKIIEFIAENNGACGLSEISRGMELNKATAYGLLSTLEQHRYVELDPDTKKYRLGLFLAELAMKVEDFLDIRTIAKPYMEKLAAKYTASIHLGIESDGEVLYIEVSKYNFVLPIVCQVNSRLPFYCTGVGKAILAFWSEERIQTYLSSQKLIAKTPNTITSTKRLEQELALIRKQGYAVENEENQIGVISVSAPIFSLNGGVVAGISIGLIKAMLTEEMKTNVIHDLLKCSEKISQEMGYKKM